MPYKTSVIIAIVAAGLIVNFVFGLYNLKVTKRVRALTKTQAFLIMLINILNTGNCVIHLLVNILIGAYGKR